MKILIVEDNQTSMILMVAFLKELGEIVQARNGKEAILAVFESLKTNTPFDIICMDVMMPEMDGQTALRQIRATQELFNIKVKTKVIMTTALDNEKNEINSFQTLCDGYLVKPIERMTLIAEINKVLQKEKL
jgi:two-component system chemotaxis response regulator CheY